jgi:hypothetical protein
MSQTIGNQSTLTTVPDNRASEITHQVLNGLFGEDKQCDSAAASAYGFDTGQINVFQALLSKNRDGLARLPLTRSDLYSNNQQRSG